MRVDAGAQLDRRVHAEPPRRLDLPAVVADVLDAGFGVLGDVVAGREIGRVVPSRRRDRHRQAVEPVPSRSRSAPVADDVLARRVVDQRAARSDRPWLRPSPGRSPRAACRSRCDRLPGSPPGPPPARSISYCRPLLVGRLREQECLALAAPECRRDTASAPAGASRCLC